MSPRLSRIATVALAVALGLAVSACKKNKPTEANAPNPPAPNPGPGIPSPGPGPGAGASDPAAPVGPFFRGQNPRTAAMREAAMTNMKTVVTALHEFHTAHRALPAGVADKTGKPGLSWRVAILPYIEANNLYNQFKLDEPWDSENNKKLIPMMPQVFAPPGQSTNGYTFCRGFTGPDTWLPPPLPGATGVRPGQLLLGANFNQFGDGTSNTILVAEAGDAVIWTKPDEMQFAPNNVPRVGGVFESGFVAGMADGSVKFVRRDISPKVLASAIQANDGGIVNLDN